MERGGFYDRKVCGKKSVKRRIYDYVMITAAACIYGVSISLFLDPNNLAPGGVTGNCGDHKPSVRTSHRYRHAADKYPDTDSGIVEVWLKVYHFHHLRYSDVCRVYHLFLPGSGRSPHSRCWPPLAGDSHGHRAGDRFQSRSDYRRGRILLLNSFGLNINILKQEGCSS